MRKGPVSRMRERYAQTVLTFRITYVLGTLCPGPGHSVVVKVPESIPGVAGDFSRGT